MNIGLIGRKKGMTRIFNEDGASTPVTVVEVLNHRVVNVKDAQSFGKSIQITTGEKSRNLKKPIAGTYAKANVAAGRGLWEFKLENEAELPNIGDEISVEIFEAGQKVDVTGISKGKGFAGVVKRHGFRMQDATHGNSLSHRAPGSIGQCQTPGRVFKGKKMAGHMGNVKRTIQNLDVVKTDNERSLLLLKGAVPGSVDSDLIIRRSVKTSKG